MTSKKTELKTQKKTLADAKTDTPRRSETQAPRSEAPAPKRRVSRIAPLQEKVVSALHQTAMSVADMAKKFDVPERDIRLAIDRARNGGENIKRVSKGTFGYEKPKDLKKAA